MPMADISFHYADKTAIEEAIYAGQLRPFTLLMAGYARQLRAAAIIAAC